MSSGSVTTTVNHAAVKALFAQDGPIGQHVADIGEQVVARAQELAPTQTGAGAASIHQEYVETDNGCESRISWDSEHFYMEYAELGTEHEPARPFLRPALP